MTPDTLEDLRRSGLTEETIKSAGIRDGSDDEVAVLLREKFKVSGFVLPYFGLDRKQLKFYRVKVLTSLNGHHPPKYLQPKASGNHLYIPPALHAIDPDWVRNTDLPLFITEGEKKALAAVQAGLPTVAVGGVFSWRTHIHQLDRGLVRVEDKASSRIVHLDDRGEKAYRTEVVSELGEIEWKDRDVFLIFDSDAESNPEVQRASFELSNWLDEHGARTFQISLADRIPDSVLRRNGFNPNAKVGLDDALALDPAFGKRLSDPDWRASEGFRPLPQDPLHWVTEQLNGRATRETQERVSTFAINWLDANGTRFMGVDGTYYFFDEETRVLHDFSPGPNLATLRQTSFGHLLVEQLGLDPADNSTMGRLIGRFPLGARVISPYRVLAHPDWAEGEAIYYQVSDSDVMRITADGLELQSNGDDDILFYRGGVDPLDLDHFAAACDEWKRPKTPLWYDALSTLNIDPLGDMTREQTLQLLTTLCYLSPWLNRWRGLMLPLEIAVGEPGSGKTFTYNLRKGVLTGRPSLAGLPDDFRSWVAAVGAAPAFWICDNLGNVRSDYWHRLNDELARLITDPAPSLELRQLYTTATTFHVPVNSAFAITTVRNPFTQPDVLQRALLYTVSAIPSGQRDPDWVTDRMRERTHWVAEHVNVLHQFLKRTETEWKANYKSGYRLVHFEQAVMVMGRVLGWNMQKVVDELPNVVSATVAQYDPVMEALVTFVEEWDRPRKKARLQEVVDWADTDMGERFTALRQLANEITLTKYINAHKYDIEQSTGMKINREGGTLILTLPGG